MFDFKNLCFFLENKGVKLQMSSKKGVGGISPLDNLKTLGVEWQESVLF